MGDVYFYHLTRAPLDETLRLLIERGQARGWAIAVRGTDPASIARLDEKLWLQPDDSFLAHGVAGGDRDAEQPVLLTTSADLPNNPACLMAIEGAEVSVEEAARLERICILFDGADAPALAHARDQWRALTAAGIAAHYWSEEGGRWQRKAQNAPADPG